MRYFLLLASLFTTTLLLAQSLPGHWCGTAHGGADYELQKTRLLENRAAVEAGIVTPRNTRYIPVKFHLSARNDGTGRISEVRVLDQFCELNEDFAPHNIQFYLADGSFNYIDNTDLYDNHLAVQTSVMQRQRDSRAMNIFIVNNPGIEDDDGTIAYYNIPRDWIVIGASFVRANNSDLSHEIGHFFSLLHTFNGYEPQPHNRPGVNAPVDSPDGPPTEFADGSNCSNAGDFLCDTPADYNNGLGAISCELTANILDPRGEAIDPDERNMLSYFLLCPDEDYFFSDLQVAVMNADYASTSRRYLKLDPVPPVEALGAPAEAVSPANDTNSAFYDRIDFEWTPTPGATSYLFELSRVSSFQVIADRRIVEGTSFSLISDELLPDRRYYWRVRPFNAHLACSDQLPNRNSFWTGTNLSTTATAEVRGLADFRVAPNPVIGTDDLILSLRADKPFPAHIQLLNLSGQTVLAPRKLELQPGDQQFRLPLMDLPNGVYFLRLRSDVGQATQKVIIAR